EPRFAVRSGCIEHHAYSASDKRRLGLSWGIDFRPQSEQWAGEKRNFAEPERCAKSSLDFWSQRFVALLGLNWSKPPTLPLQTSRIKSLRVPRRLPTLRADRPARLQPRGSLAPAAKRATPHRLRSWWRKCHQANCIVPILTMPSLRRLTQI